MGSVSSHTRVTTMKSSILSIFSLLPLCGVSLTATISNTITRNRYHQDGGDIQNYYNHLQVSGVSGLPRNVSAVDQTPCTCRQLIVSSLGAASHLQPQTMGIYTTYNQMYNGRLTCCLPLQ